MKDGGPGETGGSRRSPEPMAHGPRLMAESIARLKGRLAKEVDQRREELLRLSHRIHAHPEVAFQEERASAWVAEQLAVYGFQVERGVYGLPTAVRATYGQGRPAIGLLAEYDALPGMGHGCGHNVIAASAVGAAAAARLAADSLGGTLVVLGTPAEEAGGGKAMMAAAGAFTDLDAALMIHPGVRDTVLTWSLACTSLSIEFFGKAAHAAARPEDGINALEALILTYNAINSLRQHMRNRSRIHGIITSGGDAPNIVPAYAAAEFLVRAGTDEEVEQLQERVLQCCQGAALATGARLEHRWSEYPYRALRTNRAIAEAFGRNLRRLGRRAHAPNPARGRGSTDMGNVSVLLPAIHPSLAIAPMRISAHSPEFAEAAIQEGGDRGVLDGAKALAMTVADLLGDLTLLEEARREFLSGDSQPLD